jgi:Leu/Phe-tRNA-protein transferase
MPPWRPNNNNKYLKQKTMSRFRETKMVSFKLDLQIIEMIDQLAKEKTKGNRTWCLETIINEYFKNNEMLNITKSKEDEK